MTETGSPPSTGLEGRFGRVLFELDESITVIPRAPIIPPIDGAHDAKPRTFLPLDRSRDSYWMAGAVLMQRLQFMATLLPSSSSSDC